MFDELGTMSMELKKVSKELKLVNENLTKVIQLLQQREDREGGKESSIDPTPRNRREGRRQG